MELILIYQTDHNHSFKSRNLIGVATSKENVLPIVNNHIAWMGSLRLNSDQLYNLANIGQTQGYKEFEIATEEIEVNTLL